MITNILLVSFNFCRNDEDRNPYGVACLMAAYKASHKNCGRIVSLVIDLKEEWTQQQINQCIMAKISESQCNIVAFSNFCWSDLYIKNVQKVIRRHHPKLLQIMGGAMVCKDLVYLSEMYPETDYFINSYGEEAFSKLEYYIEQKERLIITDVKFENIISPYLSGDIRVKKGMSVRMETRRGCKFNCSYCRHRKDNSRVSDVRCVEKYVEELKLFKKSGVAKINILDPFFNDINNYNPLEAKGLKFLKLVENLGIECPVSVQIRPEMITKEYLEQASGMKNVIFEIGIQSLDPEVFPLINRGNRRNYDFIISRLQEVQKAHIKTEITLIYGLPKQTPVSFASDLETLHRMNFSCIEAFPLQIYPATSLYENYEILGLKTELVEPYGIMQVYDNGCGSFTEMRKMAEELKTR